MLEVFNSYEYHHSLNDLGLLCAKLDAENILYRDRSGPELVLVMANGKEIVISSYAAWEEAKRIESSITNQTEKISLNSMLAAIENIFRAVPEYSVKPTRGRR